ncbi:transposase [Actinomadura gamaensis]|uniref:Transposase n=1 Tax=Actinomadura gamaensis TaxID=1763541 RepID=A0ABV9TUL0_9ACTN
MSRRSGRGCRGYPPEFRRKVLDLLEAGRKVIDVAWDLEISEQTICLWRRQDRIDRGLEPGLTGAKKAELAAARARIAKVETELVATRRAIPLVREGCPTRRCQAIAVTAGEGVPTEVAGAACWMCRCRATTPGAPARRHSARFGAPG